MHRFAVFAVLLTGCMAKSKPVVMPDGREAIRIECNYEFANCERKARRECKGDYVPLTKGDLSCKDCGSDWNSQQWPQGEDVPVEAPDGNNIWKGTLYVRCR